MSTKAGGPMRRRPANDSEKDQRQELIEFFKHLQGSPRTWIKYRRKPKQVMDDWGLSKESKDLILKGEVEDVLEVIQLGPLPAGFLVW